MADITAVNGAGSTIGVSLNRTSRIETPESPSLTPDQVEFSDLARLLSALEPESQSSIRAEKVSEIRDAIANGTYETDDKLEYVVGRLMDVLRLPNEDLHS